MGSKKKKKEDGKTYRNFAFYAGSDGPLDAQVASQAQNIPLREHNQLTNKGEVVTLSAVRDEQLQARIEALKAERANVTAIDQIKDSTDEDGIVSSVSAALSIVSCPIPITFFSLFFPLLL